MRTLRTKAYLAWRDMLRRCNNPEHIAYSNYGRRGIRVAAEFHAFENFLQHMGLPPSFEYTLDRLDPNDHYRPGNLRWATRSEQSANQRDNVKYFWAGKKQTLNQWSLELGMDYYALNKRLKLLGWTVEDAFSTPVREWRRKQGERVSA